MFHLCILNYPNKINSSDAIMIQVFNEDVMIYCVKGFFEVNVDAKNKMSLVKCFIDILCNIYKSMGGRIISSEAKLVFTKNFKFV